MSTSNNVRRLFAKTERSSFKTCQWPFGHPGEAAFHFCGHPTHAHFSYCEKHAKMAYRDPEEERKAAVVAAPAETAEPARKSA